MRIIFCILTLIIPLRFIGQEIESGDSSIIRPVSEKLARQYGTQDTTFQYLTNSQLLIVPTYSITLSVDSKNNVVQRLVFSSVTSKGLFSGEYIFYEGHLIFVYQTFEYFEEIHTMTAFRNFKGFKGWESRYYFENEKMKYQKTSGAKEPYITYSEEQLKSEKTKLLNFIQSKVRE